jgi:hypothetical protein
MRIGNNRNPQGGSHFNGSSQQSESGVLFEGNAGPTTPPRQQKEW